MKLFDKKESPLMEVKGRQLVCPVCANKYFYTRQAQLNTSVASFSGFWANRSATCVFVLNAPKFFGLWNNSFFLNLKIRVYSKSDL